MKLTLEGHKITLENGRFKGLICGSFTTNIDEFLFNYKTNKNANYLTFFLSNFSCSNIIYEYDSIYFTKNVGIKNYVIVKNISKSLAEYFVFRVTLI